MIINYLDEMLDNILDSSFEYFLGKQKIKIKKNQDVSIIIDELSTKIDIEKRVKSFLISNKVNLTDLKTIKKLINIYSKYLFSYMLMFLGISYFIKNDIDFTSFVIFTTNTYLENVINSGTNSDILNLTKIAIQIQTIVDYKDEKIKLLPKEFYNTIMILKNLPDNIKSIIKENDIESKHSLIKLLIYKEMYVKTDKWFIAELFENDILNGEYKYIDVVIGEINTIEKTSIKSVLDTLNENEIEDIISMITDCNKSRIFLTVNDKLDFLVNNNFLFPITDEFIRYNCCTEAAGDKDEMFKESLKIKNIIKKVNLAENKENIEKFNLWFLSKQELNAVTYNFFDELRILSKSTDEYNRVKPSIQNKNMYEEIQYFFNQHYFDFKSSMFVYTTTKPITAFRKMNFERPKTRLDFRNIRKGEEIHIYGFVITNRFSFIYNNIYKIKAKNFKKFKNNINAIFSKKEMFEFVFIDSENMSEFIETVYENIMNELFLNIKHRSQFFNFFSESYKNKSDQEHFLNLYSKPERKNEKEINFSSLQDLPIIRIDSNEIKRFKITTTSDNIDLKTLAELSAKNIICYHFVLLDYIVRNRTNNDFDFTQAIFEFSKRFAILNDDDLMVCKSCETQIDILKFVSSGTVDLYTGDYIVTGVIDNTSLLEKKDYAIYRQIILQLDKLLGDKVAKILGLTYLVGSESKTIRKRESLLKDIIDLLVHHNDNLKNYIIVSNKLRGEKKVSIYDKKEFHIEEECSFLFAFQLDNNILLRSSTDTDKFKQFKIHNILVYVMLITILDLTESNIINIIHHHKFCNWKIYEQNISFFSKMKIIENNDQDKVSLSKFPVLMYLITIFSCFFYEYNIFQDTEKNKSVGIKMMIVSLIDLLNTILLVHFTPIQGKHFIYQIICNRFYQKANTIFQDLNLIERIKSITNKSSDIQIVSKYKTSVHSYQLDTFTKYHYDFFYKSSISTPKTIYLQKYKKKQIAVQNNSEVLTKIELPEKIKQSSHASFNEMRPLYVKNNNHLEGSIENLKNIIKIFGSCDESFILFYDHLGLKLDKPLYVSSSQCKYIQYEAKFQAPVIYFTVNKIKVFYHAKYLNYLGFREGTENETVFSGVNIYVHKDICIENKLRYLGFRKLKYNILLDVVDKILLRNPLLTADEVRKEIVTKTYSKISKTMVLECISECLKDIYNERIENLKKSLIAIRIAIGKISNLYSPIKILSETDDYNPISSLDTLINQFINTKKFIKSKSFMNNYVYFHQEATLSPVTSDTMVFSNESLCEHDSKDMNLIYYLCREFETLIKDNKDASDSAKHELINFIKNLINNQYNYHIYEYNSYNLYFEKVLYCCKLDTVFERTIEKLDIVKDENDSITEMSEISDDDESLGQQLGDIDQEEKEFDVNSDDE